jgi:hypothetical protein
VQTIVGFASQLSVAVTVKGTFAPQTPVSLHLTIGIAGQVMFGGSQSLTVMSNWHDELFGGVAASEAQHVTVVVPIGKVSPEFTTVPF